MSPRVPKLTWVYLGKQVEVLKEIKLVTVKHFGVYEHLVSMAHTVSFKG
jgi:hypothetical protein